MTVVSGVLVFQKAQYAHHADYYRKGKKMDVKEAQEQALGHLVTMLKKQTSVPSAALLGEAIAKVIAASPVKVNMVFDDGDSETDEEE